MADRSISYGSFVIERSFPVPVSRAFAAWADPAVKRRWFGSPAEGNPAHQFEFEVGGREYSEGKGPDGRTFGFDVRYADIVPDQRIVYTYEMHVDGRRMSVSLASVEFWAAGAGTRVIVTEHGAFLDGLDTVDQRENGTNWLMDKLEAELSQG